MGKRRFGQTVWFLAATTLPAARTPEMIMDDMRSHHFQKPAQREFVLALEAPQRLEVSCAQLQVSVLDEVVNQASSECSGPVPNAPDDDASNQWLRAPYK